MCTKTQVFGGSLLNFNSPRRRQNPQEMFSPMRYYSIQKYFIRNVNICNINITITRLVCVAQRCEDTVEKKQVNSGVLNYVFLEGLQQPKKSPKNPRNPFFDALLMSNFQSFAAGAAEPRTVFFPFARF